MNTLEKRLRGIMWMVSLRDGWSDYIYNSKTRTLFILISNCALEYHMDIDKKTADLMGIIYEESMF